MQSVPWGYLATLTILVMGTLSALRPPRRPAPLAAVGLRLSILVGELPFVAFAFLVASTALALAQSDPSTPVVWAALSVAVLVAGGLALVVRDGVRARPVLERALAAGLGERWRADLDGATAAGLRRRRPLWQIVLAPLWVRRPDVRRVANLRYGDAGRRNLLDVYRPRRRTAAGPVLVYFHGGGYFSGRKNREARPLLYRLASQGWVCVSANYRLRPAATFPDHLVDVKKVLAWVREHASEHGGDASTVVVAGSSAGAHLATLAALTPNDPRFQPGFEDTDTSVTAAVCLYGYFGEYYRDPARDAGERPPSTPSDYVRPDAPPFFIAHGDRDSLVPVEAARDFAERLRAVSTSPVVYAELPGAQHAFDLFHSLRFEAVVDSVEAFTGWVTAQRREGGGALGVTASEAEGRSED